MRKISSLAAAVLASCALAAAAGVASAGDKPPADIKPLSEIVKKLEQMGYTQIAEIEFDDGHWEVEVYRNGEKREVHVDPRTGEITKDKPD